MNLEGVVFIWIFSLFAQILTLLFVQESPYPGIHVETHMQWFTDTWIIVWYEKSVPYVEKTYMLLNRKILQWILINILSLIRGKGHALELSWSLLYISQSHRPGLLWNICSVLLFICVGVRPVALGKTNCTDADTARCLLHFWMNNNSPLELLVLSVQCSKDPLLGTISSAWRLNRKEP